MPFETIISCAELEQHLADKDWVIVDCRFDLATPESGFEDYQQHHIPGAVYADLDKDLSGTKTPQTGRHPLPEPDDFYRTMSLFGIEANTQVIVYDATSGSFAARLWFMLRYFGHTKVALLDGGFAEWHRLGLPLENGTITNPPCHFTGTPDPYMIVTTQQVEELHTQPDWRFIDARTTVRYRGEQEPIDPVAGRIPNAVNRFHGNNLGKDGLFLPVEQLRSVFSELVNGFDPEKVAVYCGSGVTSCHHLVAMAVAGLPQPKLYLGSWSEWIRDPSHPIARG